MTADRGPAFNIQHDGTRQAAMRHIDRFGHVLLGGVYEPEAGQTASEDMAAPGIFPPPHHAVYHSQRGLPYVVRAAARKGAAIERGPKALTEIREAITEHASSLGQVMLPAAPQREAVETCVEIRHDLDDTTGNVDITPVWQLPAPNQGPVIALTNLRGESELRIESEEGSDGVYMLRPGSVALFMARRQGDMQPRKFSQTPQDPQEGYLNYLLTTQPQSRVF